MSSLQCKALLQAQPRTQAHILSSKLTNGLTERYLCEISPSGNSFSLHKLVKQSALHFIERRTDDDDDDEDEPVDPAKDKYKTFRYVVVQRNMVWESPPQ